MQIVKILFTSPKRLIKKVFFGGGGFFSDSMFSNTCSPTNEKSSNFSVLSYTRGGQVCTFWWFHLCLRNSLQIATKICQFRQYLGTKLDILFETAKSVEIVIILGKQLFYPKVLDFMQKHYSVATFVHKYLPEKPISSIS